MVERDIAAGVAFAKGRNVGERAMSSGSAKLFEEFAQDCVRLAQKADTPKLRAKLLNLADEWMRAVVRSKTSP
jgi:hypothetical protein